MHALTFWKTVAVDQANLLERLIGLLRENGISFCIIGGQAVNAYVEPVVSLDLDLAIAVSQIAQVESLLASSFNVAHFPHSLNVSLPGSDLRVQIQTDPRYAAFIEQASEREVLGLALPVARLEDVLRGKVWAVQDSTRRASKRQKDLADIARLLEAYPQLQSQVPKEIVDSLIR